MNYHQETFHKNVVCLIMPQLKYVASDLMFEPPWDCYSAGCGDCRGTHNMGALKLYQGIKVQGHTRHSQLSKGHNSSHGLHKVISPKTAMAGGGA